MMLTPFLMISILLFCLGLYNVITRKNAVGLLIGVELILNASAINFATFAHFNGNEVGGNIFTLFIIVLAAAEAAVALAIVVSIYKQGQSIDTTQATVLRG